MRKFSLIPAVASALVGMLLLAMPHAYAQSPSPIAGDWMGSLQVPTGFLRLVVHINEDADGSLRATVDSPDQGATGIPVDAVTYADGHLHLDLASIGGAYDGTLRAQADSIDGEWSQGGMSLPLVLGRTTDAPKMNRPQEPKPPYPYDIDEVAYLNVQDSVALAGTLTLPRSGGPFPAVVLITGSGAQDRDEQVFGHKPFLILADYLTRQGIAVLRADDRGVGGSSGDFKSATSEDFARDILAAIDYLKTRKEIDPKLIGLIGHSEGGIIAPMVASRSNDVAFIVLMAGTGLPGDEILHLQDSLISKVDGLSDSAIHTQLVQQKKLFSIIEADTGVTAERKLRALMDTAVANEPEMSQMDPAAKEQVISTQVHQLMSPWFRYFLTYDPAPALKQVRCPVLVINGAKDLQVPPDENLPAIEAALKAGGNKHYTVLKLPGLNHLFQSAKTGSPEEYATIEETMSPDALKQIGDWILEQVAWKAK